MVGFSMGWCGVTSGGAPAGTITPAGVDSVLGARCGHWGFVFYSPLRTEVDPGAKPQG